MIYYVCMEMFFPFSVKNNKISQHAFGSCYSIIVNPRKKSAYNIRQKQYSSIKILHLLTSFEQKFNYTVFEFSRTIELSMRRVYFLFSLTRFAHNDSIKILWITVFSTCVRIRHLYTWTLSCTNSYCSNLLNSEMRQLNITLLFFSFSLLESCWSLF